MRNMLAASAIVVLVVGGLMGSSLLVGFVDLQNKVRGIDGRIDGLKDSISSLETAGNQLKASLNSTSSKLDETGRLAKRVEEKMSALGSQLDTLTQKAEDARNQFTRDVEKLTDRLTAAEAEARAQREENSRLRSEVSSLRQQFDTVASSAAAPAAIVYEKAKQGVVSITIYDLSNRRTGTGSGFVYSQEGYIVTNDHVAKAGSSYLLTFLDGSQIRASLVGSDSLGDIAVLFGRLPPFAKPLELVDSNKVRIGEAAFAIGSPVGLQGSITSGIVSQVNRTVTGFLLYYIQTDAPINPGNSGGPLLNSEGKVMGINTFGPSKAATEGLGFAIPANILKRVVPRLIELGSYQYPLIGVNGRFLDPIQARVMNLPSSVTSGWLVEDLVPRTGAALSDLRKGDIILAINNHPVRYEHDLIFILNQFFSPRDRITLTVLRGDATLKIDVTLSSR